MTELDIGSDRVLPLSVRVGLAIVRLLLRLLRRLLSRSGVDEVFVHVVVLNSAVVSATIRNYSSQPTRRIDMVVRVGYGDDARRASEVPLGVLVSDERALADSPPTVTVAELEPSCVRLNVRPWVKNEDYGATKNDLSARIVAALRGSDIVVAYPQMGVWIV